MHCSCGNQFYTRSTKDDLHVELCSECHPFYTGKQKLVDTGGRVERFQRRAAKHAKAGRSLSREPGGGLSARRPRPPPNGADPLRMPDGALVAKRDAPVGGQAVLEGVMMRGVSTWAVAVRNPEGQIEISSESLVPWAQRHRLWRAAGHPRRRRPRRVDEDRLQGAGDLRQRPARGRRGGRARRDRRLGLGPDDRPLAGARGRPLLRHPGRADQPDQGPARLGAALLAGRGGPAHRDLHRLHRRDQPPAGPAPRLRVPRRRAQDDLLLRGRRRAGPGAGEALLAPAPALRHQLPADRHGPRDLRLRPDRAARLVLAARLADPRHPADRRPLLRGDQVGRQEPPQTLGAGGDVAGPDAAEPDHPRARRRAARGGDRRPREGARARRRPRRAASEQQIEIVA